jgi:hypothetical protein
MAIASEHSWIRPAGEFALGVDSSELLWADGRRKMETVAVARNTDVGGPVADIGSASRLHP